MDDHQRSEARDTPQRGNKGGAQRVEMRREQILDAAAGVFAAKGFHSATIREIARAAGLADGTIYLYFSSKTELLLGLLDRLNETEQRPMALAGALEGDMRSFFVTYLRHRMQVLQTQRALLCAVLPELLVNSALRERYQRQVVAPTVELATHAIAAMVERGLLRPVDASLATRTIAGAVLGLLVEDLLGDATLAARWDELPDVLATLVFDGLRPAATPPSDEAVR